MVDGYARVWWWPEGEEERARAMCLGVAALMGGMGGEEVSLILCGASKP